ncbi:hypothetical protein C84B14_06568 [Salinisphaera sp. C84B14]|uniref:hypothetical protein n=1 Tax=Salinisphaera sp. C84B14 TaxID=1304155 RepID=UPI003342016D
MSEQIPRFDALAVGDRATTTRSFSDADMARWCDMMSVTKAPEQVPEPLIAALFSYLLGEQLPGHGTNYLKQEMQFEHAACVGEELTVEVCVSRLRRDEALVDLDTTCTGSEGRTICSGRALVLFAC